MLHIVLQCNIKHEEGGGHLVKQTSKTARVLLSNWQNSATHFNGGEKLHSLLDVLTVVWVALCLVPTMLCHHLTLPVSVLGTQIYIHVLVCNLQQ